MPVEYFDCKQGTEEWLFLHSTLPTCSKFSIIKSTGRGSGDSVLRRKYMLSIIGARITGKATKGKDYANLKRGREQEPEARRLYEFLTDNAVTTTGFIINDGVGYSPDGLVGSDVIIEIKNNIPEIQLGYMLDNKLPDEHEDQCMGGLMVSERESCDFISFWDGLTPFIFRAYRDEKKIAELRLAVRQFNDELSELEEKIRKMQ